jgi:hypothetical protein
MLMVYSHGVSFLLQALKRVLAIKPLDPASDHTERLCIQGLPQFLLIKIVREDWRNGPRYKDCNSFQFPMNLDTTQFGYNPPFRFRDQLAAVVAHLGVMAKGLGQYFTCCRLWDRCVRFNDSSVELVNDHEALEANFPEERTSTQTAGMLPYPLRARASPSGPRNKSSSSSTLLGSLQCHVLELYTYCQIS